MCVAGLAAMFGTRGLGLGTLRSDLVSSTSQGSFLSFDIKELGRHAHGVAYVFFRSW